MKGKAKITKKKICVYGVYFNTIYTMAAIIILFLYSQQILASNSAKQCLVNASTFNKMPEKYNVSSCSSGLVTINADYATGNYPDNAVFSGNVDVVHENSHLKADKIEIYQKHENLYQPVLTAQAFGNVCYKNTKILLEGKKGYANFHTKDTDVWEGNYKILGYQGHGHAYLMQQRGENRYLILENGSFTSCMPNSNIWSIVGSKVIHDRKKQITKIWNARFKLGSVPIFYSPYLQVSTGDKRRSGFLIPSAKYSTSSGFEFYFPYYWNISTNMDATVIPCYISKYGKIIWKNELRYLAHVGSGLIEIDYLPQKKKTSKNQHKKAKNRNHWFFSWKNHLVLDQNDNLNINYTKVSDYFYFNEPNSRYDSTDDVHIKQKFVANYIGNKFDTTLSIKQLQVLNRYLNRNNYEIKPKLDFYYKKNLCPFDFCIYTQKMDFINSKLDKPQLTRIHFEPTITFPLENNWISLSTEAKLLITRYQKTEFKWNNKICNTKNSVKNSFNRVLPQLKIDGKLLFAKEVDQKNGYFQTLEPRIQYLYVPYYDHSNIKNYDSSFLQIHYDGLFRDRLYSGVDRIASVNQIKTGVQTYIYDNAAIERFRLSVGQSYCFSKPCIGDNFIHQNKNKKNGFLFWTGDVYCKITDRWSLQGNWQYNNHLNKFTTYSSILEYLRDEEHLVQLSHHYATLKNIQSTFQSNFLNILNTKYKNGISRIAGTVNWPIANQWAIISSYCFDINSKKSVNHMIGLQHNSYCCAMRVSYERNMNNWNTYRNPLKYNKVIGFNIELRGLGSNRNFN